MLTPSQQAQIQALYSQYGGAGNVPDEAILAAYGLGGGGLSLPAGGVTPDIDAWLGGVSPQAQVVQALALPAVSAGILAVIRWVLSTFGLRAIVQALLGLVGIELARELTNQSGQGVREGGRHIL